MLSASHSFSRLAACRWITLRGAKTGSLGAAQRCAVGRSHLLAGQRRAGRQPTRGRGRADITPRWIGEATEEGSRSILCAGGFYFLCCLLLFVVVFPSVIVERHPAGCPGGKQGQWASRLVSETVQPVGAGK